tara:strand:+ start:1305 stop:2624 length:1320 start_codon:yes stop_codon:yes gene_type:complete
MIEELKKTFDTFNKKMSVWDIQQNKREENFKKFVEAGLPTKKLEDWKFSNFNQIISNNLKNLNIDLDEWLDLKTRIPELNKNKINFNDYFKEFEHNKVVFTNGFLNHSSFEYEKNLKAESLWHKELQGAYNDSKIILEEKEKNPLSLLNNAFFTDGLYLNIKKGFQLNKPLIIYNVFDSAKITNFFNQKLFIDIEENAKIDIFIYTINISNSPIFFNTYNNFAIGRNGLLKLYYFNNLKKKDLNYNCNNVKINNNGVFENFTFSNSADYFKNEINCSLKEQYSSAFVNGVLLNTDNQNHEIKTKIKHLSENTKSYQKIKAVVDKNSKAIFQGKIFVDAKAQKTNGYQLSKAILLNKESEFNSKPELEIYADDVKCSHGSTSGSLDEDAIFYLMSRGLSEFEAKKLLIKGFLTEAVESITNEEIKKYYLKRIENEINEYR